MKVNDVRTDMTIDEMVLARENPSSSFESLGETEALDFTAPIMAQPIKMHSILPTGEYPFTIVGVDKKYYEPKEGGKLPACWMVEVEMEADGGEAGMAKVYNRLYWYKSVQWKISEMWVAAGLAKPGMAFIPNIKDLIGKKGYCRLERKPYMKKDGTSAFYNEVKRCYPLPA